MSNGLQEIVFSVFDIDRIAVPMVEVGGYTRAALPDAPPEQWAAWDVPAACTRIEQCLLTPGGDDRGHLRLVVFHGVEREVIRSSQSAWDTGGIFDIDIFSKDVTGVYRRLQQEFGWTAFGDPVDYEIGEFKVRQVVAMGPDGLNIALIQPHNPPLFALPPYSAMSRIFNTTQFVRDFDATMAFYQDVLGWKPLMSTTVVGDAEPSRLIGLPMPVCAHIERKVAIVHPDGENDGSVEIMSCVGIDGVDFADRAVAPNVGLLALRFPVKDAHAYAAELQSRGGVLYREPAAVEIAPYGATTAFAIRTPDGAILEFYQLA